jgi:peptidoglycan hydrolase CwlO-like protein
MQKRNSILKKDKEEIEDEMIGSARGRFLNKIEKSNNDYIPIRRSISNERKERVEIIEKLERRKSNSKGRKQLLEDENNFPNYDYFFPTEASNRDNKIFIRNCQQKISELLGDKIKIENELFKIPEKQKSLSQINKKKVLEDKLDSVENEINRIKSQIRDLKKQIY